MRKVLGAIVTATLFAATGAFAAPAAQAEPAVEINRGWCMSNIPTWQKPILAPGKIGMGPLIILDGNGVGNDYVVRYPDNAFGGAGGCNKNGS